MSRRGGVCGRGMRGLGGVGDGWRDERRGCGRGGRFGKGGELGQVDGFGGGGGLVLGGGDRFDVADGLGDDRDGLESGGEHVDRGGGGRRDLEPVALLGDLEDGRAAGEGAGDVMLQAGTRAELYGFGDDAVAFDEILVEPKTDAVGGLDGGERAGRGGDE